MIVLRLLPVILSFLLLAAHFSRVNLLPLVIVCIIVPFLLFIKRIWVVRTIQIILFLGAIEWVRSMLSYIEIRKSINDDWTKLAIILSVVALFTALSGLTLQMKNLKKVYFKAKQNCIIWNIYDSIHPDLLSSNFLLLVYI